MSQFLDNTINFGLFMNFQKREEEIKNLKEKLEDLNKDYEGLNQEIKNLNALITQVCLIYSIQSF